MIYCDDYTSTAMLAQCNNCLISTVGFKLKRPIVNWFLIYNHDIENILKNQDQFIIVQPKAMSDRRPYWHNQTN